MKFFHLTTKLLKSIELRFLKSSFKLTFMFDDHTQTKKYYFGAQHILRNCVYNSVISYIGSSNEKKNNKKPTCNLGMFFKVVSFDS